MRPTLRHLLWTLVLPLTPSALAAQAAPPIGSPAVTILHTNDLHSHFRPERDARGLGGVARLKTAIDRIRSRQPEGTVLVDGGDFSEGQAYYLLGAGAETFRMMNDLGYDFAAVGNHDWLNGAGTLLDAYHAAAPSLRLLGANFDASDLPRRQAEFEQTVLPYSIKTVGGYRIGFVGLATFELIYDAYISPVKITEPITALRKAVRDLRGRADFIVLVSHNTLKLNAEIAKAVPEVGLVIGAHDHAFLREPMKVRRNGKPDAWMVEVGSWGRFLGQVDLTVGQSGQLELLQYTVHAIDSRYLPDPLIAARVERAEHLISEQYGPLWKNEVGRSTIEIHRDGVESPMGNLATDAYRNATQADIALDQIAFIYGSLPKGRLTEADVLNANPAIFNPVSERLWTLHLLDLPGRTLERILTAVYSTRFLGASGILSVSGMRLTFDPWLAQQRQMLPTEKVSPMNLAQILSGPVPEDVEDYTILREIRVGDHPLERNKNYRIAMSGGIKRVFEILSSLLPFGIPLDSLRDTGIEAWRSIADHVRRISPITESSITMGNRVRTWQADLVPSVATRDVRWERTGPNELRVLLDVQVRNQGELSARGTQRVRAISEPKAWDPTLQAEWELIGIGARDLQGLESDESFRTQIEGRFRIERLPTLIWVNVETAPGEIQTANNSVPVWIGDSL